ncbi:MAG: hypothetical protein IPF42_09450 [Candidatus Microthrix sp.]|nr:hypothetical protein [Candidatus Microthrix sp.]
MISTLQSGRWASPMMAAGMIRIGEVANRVFDGAISREWPTQPVRPVGC